MRSIKSIKSISSVLLAEEALQRGITVKHLNPYREDEAFLELDYKNHKEFIIGQRISKTSLEAYWILENKDLTKEFLKRNDINIAKGKAFQKGDDEKIIDYCKKINYPVVIKPVDGTQGNSVYVGIKNRDELELKLKNIFRKNNNILAEEMFDGKEYRIFATRKKFIAAAIRKPANIVGDGVRNIKELINMKNSDHRRGKNFRMETPFKIIKIDDIVKQHLRKLDLKSDYIIPKGNTIYLRKNSNLSTGGDSIDVTDKIHIELKKIAVKVIKAIPNLEYAGIDLMTNRDISKKPTKDSYIIVEMNSSPGIFLHHFPYRGKSRNIAKEIIDILFPETKF